MAAIHSQRRYWAYEPTTLDMEEVLQGTPDETAHRVAPFLNDISTEYVEDGGLEIHFTAPEGEKYFAHCYAVIPEPDEDEEEAELDEEEIDDQGYAWMVEIYPGKAAGVADPELVDYEAIFYWPKEGERIRFQETVPALAAIAEAVYALSDVDSGSPAAPVDDILM